MFYTSSKMKSILCSNTSNNSLRNLVPGYIISLREISLHLVDVSNTILVLKVTQSHLTLKPANATVTPEVLVQSLQKFTLRCAIPY